MTQADKQNVLKQFRYMSQNIKTDVLHDQLVKVDFIPIKKRNNKNVEKKNA